MAASEGFPEELRGSIGEYLAKPEKILEELTRLELRVFVGELEDGKKLNRAERMCLRAHTTEDGLYKEVSESLASKKVEEKYFPYICTLTSAIRKLQKETKVNYLRHYPPMNGKEFFPMCFERSGEIRTACKFICATACHARPNSLSSRSERPMVIVPYKEKVAVIPYSANKEEKEVIFEPGTRFKCVYGMYFELPPDEQTSLLIPAGWTLGD